MHSTKQAWRAELKRKRLDLTAQEVARLGASIVERLKTSMPWQEIKSLHCFEPIASQNEPDIVPFVRYLQAKYPELDIYTSRKIDDVWQAVHWDGDEPKTVPAFDAVIVPMLGFDDSLHRLGYGGGYYDRFLATQPQAQKIGVCFELGHVDKLPTEAHDIRMDIIITETREYTPKR